MTRHNVDVRLSRGQADYLLEVLEDVLPNLADPDDVTTAEAAYRKLSRAVGKVNARVNCDENCSCRRRRA